MNYHYKYFFQTINMKKFKNNYLKMLENLKSSFFIQKLFSYLLEVKALNIAKYNKSLQNELNINIMNYKMFSGKYLVYEENGKGKIYNAYNNLVIFEGEIVNGKKNGKGKEDIEFGNLYEGEFLDGKRNGKGREVDGYDLIFEGEYLNGKRWNGIGYYFKEKYDWKGGKAFMKEYNRNNSLYFEGQYINGERNGKGKEYDFNVIIFEGEYLNGKRWNGKGYDANQNICYELKDGNGYVKEYDDLGNLKFEGKYLNGMKNGKWKEYAFDVLIFEGKYLNGMKNGKGKEYDINNGELIFDGEFLYNVKRKGKEYFKGNLVYEGEYLYNKRYNGKTFDQNGNVIYKLNNGNGKTREYYDDNDIFS